METENEPVFEAFGSFEFVCEENDARDENGYSITEQNPASSFVTEISPDGKTITYRAASHAALASREAQALKEIGVSPLWIEHLIVGTSPKMDERERRKLIQDAVDEAFKQMTHELIHTYRPRDSF